MPAVEVDQDGAGPGPGAVAVDVEPVPPTAGAVREVGDPLDIEATAQERQQQGTQQRHLPPQSRGQLRVDHAAPVRAQGRGHRALLDTPGAHGPAQHHHQAGQRGYAQRCRDQPERGGQIAPVQAGQGRRQHQHHGHDRQLVVDHADQVRRGAEAAPGARGHSAQAVQIAIRTAPIRSPRAMVRSSPHRRSRRGRRRRGSGPGG